MIELIKKFWMEWAMGLIATACALGYRRLVRRMNRTNTEGEALKQGMRALLRDRIIQGYNYYMDKKCWPIYARDTILDMFRQYTALGGNGTVTDLLEELKELPTEKRGE